MCGICGLFERGGGAVEAEILGRMIHRMSHRGPDGEGRFVNCEIALGHRRLSIIDAAGGAQPMANEERTLQVVFNGEIHNYLELQAELERAGHQFRSRSDTEVILHAYEEWGRGCVEHFNGMFAFGLWDSLRRELFLARDHLGIKPLYYAEVGGRFLFASEIKALLAVPRCPREVDLDALGELFTFRYVPSPRTLFRGICKLPPGHRMIVSSHRTEVERFWSWVPSLREDRDERELVEEYQYLLEDAVRLQLRSDVPVGLFLSSGIDSGALLALMSKFSPTPVQAFTIGFAGGEETNEVDDARSLARAFGAEHHSMMLKPEDYRRHFKEYLWNLEEPVGNETAAAFYFLSRIASEKVKVALTGQGADEPWAGYDRHLGVGLSNLYSRLPAALTDSLAPLIARIPGRLERLKRGVLALNEPDVLTRFAKIYSFFTAEMKQQLFRGPLRQHMADRGFLPKEALRRLQSDVQHLDPVSQMLYIDTRANLPDDLLMVVDKTSMVNSLEARVPFLDYRLVEFIETLPVGLKLRGLTGKYLHKRALRRWLPSEVIYRRKKGFANPVEEWFRREMRPVVEEYLLAPDSSVGLFFDQAYIRRMLEMDREGREQFRRHIFLLVSFELWHRTFMRH